MITLRGKEASGGIAIGPLREFAKEKHVVRKEKTQDKEAEILRFEEARQIATEQLQKLYDRAAEQAGETNAAIFEAHQMMLEDEDFNDSVKSIISEESLNAEFAVEATGEKFAAMFAAMDSEYMKARAEDIKDISNRVVRILSGEVDRTLEDDGSSYILVTDDLTPSETIVLDRKRVLAFVTRKGSVNSHTAILARTMNIPAVVFVRADTGIDGKTAIVDGDKGIVMIEPDQKILDEYKEQAKKQQERRELLLRLKGVPSVTKDGKEIRLNANIGVISDVDVAISNGASGIGLFRTEFLYLGSDTFPTEERQFEAYKAVAEKMGGKEVIIRTLDAGADKKIDYLNLEKEVNPALGFRAIRICLTNEKLFKTQLRAIYRASAYGNISVMLPMITSLWEVRNSKRIIKEVMAELKEEGVAFKDIDVGIMIETPAAVMLAEELAREVDFFSIGSNDLTQYTLAIDRQNEKLDRFYDPNHTAVLRMIKMVADSAHRNGIWVGICGELGANTDMTEKFVKMGIDELSMPPGRILPVLDKIIHTSVK